METIDYSRFILAFGFVIGLIWAAAWAAKRFGLDKKMRGIGVGNGRMQVSEVLYLDPKRKLTLVRVDAKEYLLLLSEQHTEIIDRFEKAP